MGNLKIKINKPKLVKMLNKYKLDNQFDLHRPLPTPRKKYGSTSMKHQDFEIRTETDMTDLRVLENSKRILYSSSASSFANLKVLIRPQTRTGTRPSPAISRLASSIGVSRTDQASSYHHNIIDKPYTFSEIVNYWLTGMYI